MGRESKPVQSSPNRLLNFTESSPIFYEIDALIDINIMKKLNLML